MYYKISTKIYKHKAKDSQSKVNELTEYKTPNYFKDDLNDRVLECFMHLRCYKFRFYIAKCRETYSQVITTYNPLETSEFIRNICVGIFRFFLYICKDITSSLNWKYWRHCLLYIRHLGDFLRHLFILFMVCFHGS